MRPRHIVWCACLVGMGSLLTVYGQAPPRAAAGGPPGGYLTAVAASRDGATLYASAFSGVFRSTDAGASWVETSNGLPDGSCDLAVHPADGRIVFAECSDQLFKSSDRGKTWRRIADGAGVPAVAPSNPDLLVATSNRAGELLVSRNGGRRWERLTIAGLPVQRVQQVAICRTNPVVMYAVADGRLFRSGDEGRHWTGVDLGLGSKPEVHLVRGDASAADVIYVAAGPTLIRGNASGRSWTVIREFPGQIADVIFRGPPSGRAPVIWALRELHLSDNDGGWRVIGREPDGVVRNITGDGVSSTLYAATSGGLMTSTDGGAYWNLATADNLGRVTVDGVSIGRGTLRVSTDGQEFSSHDDGATWRAVERLPGLLDLDEQTSMAPSDPSVRYRNGKDGLRRSMDGGQRWAEADRPPHADQHALAISPHDPALLYTTAGDVMRPKSVWRSRDGARTWTRVDQCSESPLTFTCEVIFDPNDANTVYVKTRNESPSAGWETVRRSVDGGSTWQNVQTPKAVVWLLVVLPTTPTTLFVDVPGGAPDARHTLWKSTDRGDHWQRSDTGLPPGNPVTAIAMDPVRHSKLVAGTDGRGVFLSNDGGATWRPTRPRLARP